MTDSEKLERLRTKVLVLEDRFDRPGGVYEELEKLLKRIVVLEADFYAEAEERPREPLEVRGNVITFPGPDGAA